MDRQLNELLKKNKKSEQINSNKDKKTYKKSSEDQQYTPNTFQKVNVKRTSKTNEKTKEKLFFEAQLRIKGRTKREIRGNFINGISNILAYKYSATDKIYNGTIIESLICNKNCHAVAIFKDYMILDYIDEFLKRFYNTIESRERVPKIANYYKNYLKFFCNPVFMNFEVNCIIQGYGDCKAELYYKNNYGEKGGNSAKPSSQKDINNKDKLFSTTIKENIENDSFTKTDINMEQSVVINKMKVDESHLVLNDLSQLSSKSGLITRRSKEDSFISNLLTNLNTNKVNHGDIFNVDQMTRNKPKIIHQLNSNFDKFKLDKKKKETMPVNKDYNLNQIEKLIKEIETKAQKIDNIKGKNDVIQNHSSNFNTGKVNVNIASNRLISSSIPNDEKRSVKNTINLAKKDYFPEKKLSVDKNEQIETKNDVNKNLIFTNNQLESPNSKSPITSNSTRLNEFNNYKIAKPKESINSMNTVNQQKNIYSTDNLYSGINNKSNNGVNNNNPSSNKIINNYINLKQTKVGTNPNENKPKKIKSIDLTGNPSTNLDQKYALDTRNNAKSPELKNLHGIEKSSDSRLEGNYFGSTMNSANRNSLPNKNSVLNNATTNAQSLADKQNLNNLMKITLSLCVDKLGKSRPSSNLNAKKYPSTYFPSSTNLEKNNNINKESGRKTGIENKPESISNFNINININNMKYTPTTYEGLYNEKSYKDKITNLNDNIKSSSEKTKTFSRNKQMIYEKTQKETKNQKVSDMDIKMFSSYNNIQKIADKNIKKDFKAMTNPKQFEDVNKNIPEYTTHYIESKKPHSNTKYPENELSSNKQAYSSYKLINEKMLVDSKAGGLKGSNNNLLVKGKTSSVNKAFDAKRIIESSSEKTNKILTVFHSSSSDKKVFQKIK